MYVWTRIDNGPLAESEGVAGEDPKQYLVVKANVLWPIYVLYIL